MVKKSSILFAVFISLALLFISAKYNAGNSQYVGNSLEYGWKTNCLVNPFGEVKVDDAANANSRSYLKYIIPFFRVSFFGY